MSILSQIRRDLRHKTIRNLCYFIMKKLTVKKMWPIAQMPRKEFVVPAVLHKICLERCDKKRKIPAEKRPTKTTIISLVGSGALNLSSRPGPGDQGEVFVPPTIPQFCSQSTNWDEVDEYLPVFAKSGTFGL